MRIKYKNIRKQWNTVAMLIDGRIPSHSLRFPFVSYSVMSSATFDEAPNASLLPAIIRVITCHYTCHYLPMYFGTYDYTKKKSSALITTLNDSSQPLNEKVKFN